MKKVLCATIVGLVFSFTCFASDMTTGGAHTPCPHSNPDKASQVKTDRRVASILGNIGLANEAEAYSIDQEQGE